MPGISGTVSQRLEHIANTIETTSPESADRLRDLGAAVDGGQYADMWATADIFQLIDADTIADHVQTQGTWGDWFRVMELLRNALVFAPIAVTWLGIWHALKSYTLYIHAFPDMASLSFLYLWQQGFGGASITLSTIALIDGTLLLIVFLLTVVVLWYGNQRDVDAQHVRETLASVLTDASLALGHRRMQQTAHATETVERVVRDMLAEMRQERARVHTLTHHKEQQIGDVNAFMQSFMQSGQQMMTAVQTLQQIAHHMEHLLQSVTQSLQHVTEQQTAQHHDVLQATHHTTAQLVALAETHQAIGDDMQTMGATLQAMGTNLSLLIQNLSGQQHDFVSTTSHVASQFKHLTDAQKTIGINLQTMLINMQSMSMDIRTTVDTLQTAASETARAASEVGSLLPILLQMQQQLTQTHTRQQVPSHAAPATSTNTQARDGN